jgi:RNA-binding protein
LSLGWQSDDYLVTSAFENALRVIDMLTSKQRAFLKSQAHSMKPIVQIGKNGLNDQIKTSVRNALDARELIKVTLLQNTDEDIHEVAEILEDEIGCDTVLKIGRIIILYKESSKKQNRKISPKVKDLNK